MTSTVEEAKSALWSIPATGLDNAGWVRVGMAWKAAGGDLSEWDEWSRQDAAKYQPGECARRWKSFKSDGGVTEKTLFMLAHESGWNGGIRYQRSLPSQTEDMSGKTPEQQLSACLDALFERDELVCIVTGSSFDRKRAKWRPSGAGKCHRVGDLLDKLETGSAEDAIGTYSKEAGAWFCPNPVNGEGHKNEDVTAYRHVLVESDELPIAKQIQIVRSMNVPVSTLALSGGKSAHALVKIDADGPNHYAERVAELYAACDAAGLRVDGQNKNPGRLSRLPGVVRGDYEQKLVAVKFGASSWREWSNANVKPVDPDSKTFNHAKFAKRLMEERNVCFIDGAISAWTGSCYTMGQRAVESAMIDMKDNIKDSNRREVLKYMTIKADREEAADKRYIAFNNCVLDVITMETMRMTPEMRIANIIPHDWNPEAESSVVDQTLAKIANGDADVLQNLIEGIGMCMYRGTEFETCLILLGNGSNGKSTYINMIHRILGDDNCSSLDMGTIGERFQTVPLMGKLANLGDDISNEFVSGNKLAIIKKIVTGDYLAAEYKGGDTFTFRPYCTLVFSCNEVPRMGDHSHGMERRLHPIPFNATFSSSDPDFNPNIESELSEEEAIEHAIALGIEGLRQCIERKSLTKSEAGKSILRRIKLDNDSVALFAEEEWPTGVNGYIIRKLYDGYVEFCQDAGLNDVSRPKFTARMCEIFNAKSVTKRIDGNVERVFKSQENG